MLKTVLAATTALVLVGGALSYADPGHPGHAKHHSRPSAADISAYGDARIAALHAGLKLSAEQEKDWPAVEAAMKDLAKQRSERAAARASADKPKDLIERLAARGQAQESRGAALKKFADAAAPLYKTLDEGQKRRFMVLARLGQHGFGHARGHHAWREGRGPGGMHHHHQRHDGGAQGDERGAQPQ